MKHKQFDSVMPYGYFLVRKSDNMKYVGIRYANVKYNLTPNQDFGKVYFTSGRLRKEFKSNPDNFWFKLCYTFDSIEELFEWERKIALRIYKSPVWANQGWGQNYGDNPVIGQLISEGKNAIGKDGKTSVERGADKLKDWIWNTEEGAEHRTAIGERISEMRASWSDEKEAEVQAKRALSMDFKAAARKAHVTRSKVDDEGFTIYQRSAVKMHETKLANGTYEVQGKAFSAWAWNTEEGELYRANASQRTKEWRKSLTDEQNKELSDKISATRLANKDKLQPIYEAAAKRRLEVGEDGLNDFQRAAIKTNETKLANGTYTKASAKRSELFNKKLGEMSEEEFEEYCAKYIPRLAKSFRTRRNNYLKKISEEVTALA